MSKKNTTPEVDQNKYIQGDVILRRISDVASLSSLPEGLTKLEGSVLQMSEVTGHHHHFRPEAKVEVYGRNHPVEGDTGVRTITPDENKYILVFEDELLYHGKSFEPKPAAKGTGDHNAFAVPAGTYEVVITREFDYDRMEERRVVD